MLDVIANSQVTLPGLSSRTHDLHREERDVLQRLGVSLLTGGADKEAGERLQSIRTELEAAYAAQRLLESAVAVR